MTLSKIRIKALITFLFSCVTVLVILESCSSEKKKNIESKINFEDSIDICLTKYDFESARNYLSRSEVNDKKKKLLAIVKAEIAFYVRDIDETDFGSGGREGEKLRYKLIEDVVEALLDKIQYNQ